METAKKTALYDVHVALGGKIINFSGWALPVQYEGILQEHEAVRTKAGIFDVSHMGEVDVWGEGAMDFVQNLVTNDIEKIADGQIAYTVMCNPEGGVVDDLLVYRYDSAHFLLVINAANIEKDFEWMKSQSGSFDVRLENRSDSVAEVAIQGPLAQEILQKSVDVNLDDIAFFHFMPEVHIAGETCLISRTGYTGEDGFEVYTRQEGIVAVFHAIMEAGTPLGLKPAGLGARDTLRFEAALPLYGNELSDEISPLEAGLGIFVKLDKKAFIGKEALVAQKEKGLPRKTIGLEIEKGIARHGYPVYDGELCVGHVTTGYQSPTLKRSIALALVDADHAEKGKTLQVQVRKNKIPATVVGKRFYQKNYKK